MYKYKKYKGAYKQFYLPRGCVSPEIGKLSCKPVVDLIESQLSVWRLQNSLKVVRETRSLAENTDREKRSCAGSLETYMTYKGGVGKGRPDISILVELTVLSKL